ncbi:MAG: hypothetical protein HY912_05685 [Desulfomonile tiedjei]|uniref:Uncharacterized protein n=1 Tax=Desulfomonile tiedjei TaxID=2358 RepID=A0A9D6YZL8_9BACT|nr:hypothetical protein [Desulfomonile tiedjei]
MSECSITSSDQAKNWPEGVISAKITMNPYILVMAGEEAEKRGMKLWELINIAIWEKLGEPSFDDLTEFAANLEIFDEDPKWKKRLKIVASHEVTVAEMKAEKALAMDPLKDIGDDGEGPG